MLAIKQNLTALLLLIVLLVGMLAGGLILSSAWGAMVPGNLGQAVRLLLRGTNPGPPDLAGGANIYIPGHVGMNGSAVWMDPASSNALCISGAWNEPTPDLFRDLDCDNVFDVGVETLGLGSGGGGGGGAGFPFLTAASEGTAAIIGNGVGGLKVWFDTALNMKCFDGVSDCNTVQSLPSGTTWEVQGDGTLLERMTAAGVHTYHNAGRPTSSLQWSAMAMNGDGVECDAAPTDETINGLPTQGMRCPMTSSETDGFIYGVGYELPGNFDKTGDLGFNAGAYLITDNGAGTWHGQISIACISEGEPPGAWGTEVGLDLTPVAADVVDDEIRDSAASVVDTDTGGADCDPGDTLYWRYRSCDTNASPTAGCTSSAGFENDMSLFLVRASFRKNSRTE